MDYEIYVRNRHTHKKDRESRKPLNTTQHRKYQTKLSETDERKKYACFNGTCSFFVGVNRVSMVLLNVLGCCILYIFHYTHSRYCRHTQKHTHTHISKMYMRSHYYYMFQSWCSRPSLLFTSFKCDIHYSGSFHCNDANIFEERTFFSLLSRFV